VELRVQGVQEEEVVVQPVEARGLLEQLIEALVAVVLAVIMAVQVPAVQADLVLLLYDTQIHIVQLVQQQVPRL
jgi:hypothetical protein